MARIKRSVASRNRRRKILKHTKGYVGGRGRLLRSAMETLHRAWAYSYRDRKNRKREFRQLWIARISAAAKQNNTSYSKFIGCCKKANIELDRKSLSEIAARFPEDFARLTTMVTTGE